MNAVNLIPAEERRGRSSAGRSGGLVYVLLGTLAVLAVLAGAAGLASKSIHDRRAQIADVSARADAAERTVKDLAGYKDFAAMRRERTATVKGLLDSRVDWARKLHEVARTLPAGASLTALHGSSGAPSSAPSGTSAPAAAAAKPAPSIELGGCTTSQAAVSRLMVELRRIDGVTGVRLSSSNKGGSGSGSTPSSSSGPGSGACSGGDRATFSMTVSFQAPSAGASSTGQSPTPESTP